MDVKPKANSYSLARLSTFIVYYLRYHMAFFYESEFVFIGRGDESFLENYSYELSDDPGSVGGKIFMALEILNNQAEAEDIGETIFSNFKDAFYEDLEGDPYERFEEALKKTNHVIEALKEEKTARFIGNLNIAIGAVIGDSLYISVTGDSEVYLVRKRFVSIVSEGLVQDSKKETFVNIANGTLERNDSVLFSSSRLLRYITKGELGKIFSGVGRGAIGDTLAELQDFIMTEILGRSAVIGVHADEVEEGVVGGENVFEAEASTSKLGSLIKKIPGVERFKDFSLTEKFPALGKVGEKIRDLVPKRLTKEKLSKKIPKIRFHQHMSRERILIVVIFLLAVLIGGIFWIRTRGSQRRIIAEQQARLNHVNELMNDASTVGQFDKSKAAELLVAAEQETLIVLNSRFLRGEAVKTLDEIQDFRDNLDDVKRIDNPTVLADFSEKRGTVSALGLLAMRDRLYGFEYNALYEMVLDKLQDPLTISDLETVILGADFEDRNALLFLTRTGKMIEYIDGRFGFISTKDGIWKKGVDMKTYNNRLYILDPERNQVWRYPRRRDSFDIGEGYNQDADLSQGVSLAIDANIYILNADGTIIQLYQGQKQNYPLRKAPLDAVVEPTRLYTNTDLGFLYILEPGKQRVVVFRKDNQNGGAQYHTQYVFDNVGVLRDMLVADNRLYVMDEKRVYFVNLSGL